MTPTPNPPAPFCPIVPHAQVLISSLDKLGKQMRTLRQEMRGCKTCPSFPAGCPIILDLSSKIEQAIRAVTVELGILSP